MKEHFLTGADVIQNPNRNNNIMPILFSES